MPTIPSALRLSSAALQHGDEADGASDRVAGFSFDDEHDLLFALGWPHLELFDDETPDDPAAAVLDVYRSHSFDRAVWPREVSARLARVMCAPPRAMFDAVRGTIQPDATGLALLARPGPITPDEIPLLVSEHATRPGTTAGVLSKALRLLEAHVGPEPVVAALTEVIEAWPATRWQKSERLAYDTVLCFAPLLLRLHRVSGAPHRERLEALFRAHAPASLAKRGGTTEGPIRALDLVLHGREGALRSAPPWPDRTVLRWLRQSPDVVIEWLRKLDGPGDGVVDVRLAFVGGAEALELERAWWRRYREPTGPGDAQRTFVETYGHVKAPAVVEIIVEMAAVSRAKKAAASWLRAHAAYATPIIERMAAVKAPRATWAKAALSRLARP